MFSKITPTTALPALLWTASQASASLLYVASYSGTVTTLNMTSAGQASHGATVPVLKSVATTQGCAGSPSWLTLDHPKAVLYCIDEGLTTEPHGSLSSYRTNEDGSLSQLDKVQTVAGPVSGVFYGKDRSGLAMAHYDGSSVSAWDVSNPSSIGEIQTNTFKLRGPGPDPDRQDAPHPHEAVLDPTGKFLLVPDLGADLIRLFVYNESTLKLTAITPFAVKPGSGPRHIAFVVKGGNTYLYLATELGNTLVGYKVTYPKGSIKLSEMFTIGVHGEGQKSPKGSSAAEVVISPDTNFLIVSSRDENKLTIPNFDPKNSTRIVSDPLVNYSIDNTGALHKIQDVPCGGREPRQFSMNKAGTLVAVGLQADGRVALINRDVQTGMLGDFAGYANVKGEITAVIFNE